VNSILTEKLHHIIDQLEVHGATKIKINSLTDSGDRVDITIRFTLDTEEQPSGDFEEA